MRGPCYGESTGVFLLDQFEFCGFVEVWRVGCAVVSVRSGAFVSSSELAWG
jgi:hypothetical protein